MILTQKAKVFKGFEKIYFGIMNEIELVYLWNITLQRFGRPLYAYSFHKNTKNAQST